MKKTKQILFLFFLIGLYVWDLHTPKNPHYQYALPPLIIAGAIAGAGAIAKGVGGIIQTHKANKALKEINKTPYPEYGISPELRNAYARAEANTKYGFSPEEAAAFQQQLTRSQTGQFSAAKDMGGSPQAINAVLQANQTGAINQFAGQGAEIKRQNIQTANQLAGQLQSQYNLIDQSKIQRRQILEEAYGSAKKQGQENTWGAVNDLTNIGTSMVGGGKGGMRYGIPPSSNTINSFDYMGSDLENSPM